MKKTNKKNSTARKLLPAFAMLTVSAISLSSATYAWFTMNKEVNVTGMKLQAKAEAGLLINEVADATDSHWDEAAAANSQPGTSLIPTSTTNGVKWFHANSKTANDEAGATSNAKSDNLAGFYEELTGLSTADTAATAGSQAANSVYYKNNDGTAGYSADSTDNAYYIMYKYYLKVSNEQGLTGMSNTAANSQCVAIKGITVTNESTDTAENNKISSTDLNKALRVGIKIGGKMYIYAPMYGNDATSDSYYATTSITNTPTTGTITSQAITNAEVLPFAKNAMTYTALSSLPGISGKEVTVDDGNGGTTKAYQGEEVDIYVWFEGEDDNCQSDKITKYLDNITVDVAFSLETTPATAPSAITNNEF